jgi:7,8-dihydropterin-6-yl-methyl-4-(beta-D-ribofuranosyl)aminobenzene 5'-phosphate synthase
MKVTSLIDDECQGRGLEGEHGLSFLIEWNDKTILFDTGATGRFADNAEKLGIDIGAVDVAVISHGHYDHAGGLERFFQENSRAQVYMAGGADLNHYSKDPGSPYKYIGIDENVLNKYNNRITFLKGRTEIMDDIFILKEFKKGYPIPKGNKYLYMEKEGAILNDTFDHEIVMVLKEDKAIVVFSGCSHRGIINVVETVFDEFKNIPVKAVFGGFHLMGRPSSGMVEDKEDIIFTAEKLSQYKIERIYTCHCTGKRAFTILKNVLGGGIDYISTGDHVKV